jgi:hypothetical protein
MRSSRRKKDGGAALGIESHRLTENEKSKKNEGEGGLTKNRKL